MTTQLLILLYSTERCALNSSRVFMHQNSVQINTGIDYPN